VYGSDQPDGEVYAAFASLIRKGALVVTQENPSEIPPWRLATGALEIARETLSLGRDLRDRSGMSETGIFRQLDSLVQNYSMKNSRIEEAILLAVGNRWTKVAKVIGKVAVAMGTNVPTEVISEHIEVLIRAGRLEAQGNTKNWRFSEVRRSGPNTHHCGVNQ